MAKKKKRKKKWHIDFEPLFRFLYPPDLYKIRKPYTPILRAEPGQQYVIIGSRTSGKTHTMVALTNAYAYAFPGIRIAYSLPSENQVKRIAKENFSEFIYKSPKIRDLFKNDTEASKVMSKKYLNGSLVNFFWQQVTKDDPAEKARGTHPDILIFDEVQDLLEEYIGVLKPATLESDFGITYMAGTFKTEYHLSYDAWADGTQHEWVVKCPSCGYEMIPDLSVIDLENLEVGPFCPRCHRPLSRKDIKENGRLVPMNPDADYVSLRISALFNYWTPWKKILEIITSANMPNYLIINEIVALPTEITARGLTKEDVKKACENYSLRDTPDEETVKKYAIFAGIDWAGEHSNTVVTIIGYRAGKYRVLSLSKIEGLKVPANEHLDRVMRFLRLWRPLFIYADWGMGLQRNELLFKEFKGAVVEFVQVDTPIKYSHNLERARGGKHASLATLFAAIKRKEIVFPKYEDIKEFVREYTVYVLSEYRRGEYLVYEKEDTNAKDDALMSLLYAYYAAQNAVKDGVIGELAFGSSSITDIFDPWTYLQDVKSF